MLARLTFGSVSVSLEVGDVSPTIALSYEEELPILFPKWTVKGQLEGYLFEDVNENRKRDRGEKGLGGVFLQLDAVEALTGKDGRFRFIPLPEGVYSLVLVSLGPRYVPVLRMPFPVQLVAGKVERVDIPVVRSAMITGRVVVLDEERPAGLSREGRAEEPAGRPPDEGMGLSGIAIRLTSRQQTYEQVSDRAGYFRFDGLRPGQWVLEISTEQLPLHHYLARNMFEFDLDPGQHTELLIKVFRKYRPIQLIEEGELEVEEEGE
jgi:hypothetical protein